MTPPPVLGAPLPLGADTSRLDLAPQSLGLYALYAWCRSCREETHHWTPKMA